ncbi:MAG: TonB-dependent receptor [bacterium]
MFKLTQKIMFMVLLFCVVLGQEFDELKGFDEVKFIKEEIEFSFKVRGLSKYSKSVLDSPAFISIIFPEELRLFYYPSISDLLNFSPGLYVVEDGAYWYVGSRGVQVPGSYNSRILSLIDGVPSNEIIFGAPFVRYPFLFDSVEIVHGYSNVYSGGNSLVATINFIPYFSTNSYSNRIFSSLYFMDGVRGVSGNTNFVAIKLDKPEVYLGLNFFSYFGRDIFLHQRDEYSFKDDNYYSRFWYLYTSFFGKNSVTQFYVFNEFDRLHFPTGAYGITLNDRFDHIDQNTNQFFVKHSVSFQGSSLNFWIYGINYTEFAEYPISSQGFINIDHLRGNSVGMDLNYSKIGKNFSYIVGLEYKNLSFSLRNYDVDYFSRDFSQEYLYVKRVGLPFIALYFTYDWYFSRDWIFSFSLRYDSYGDIYDNFKSIILPNFALIRRYKDRSVKLVYSTNYRVPSINEYFYNDGGLSTLNNPYLQPERHTTWELIYYREFKSSSLYGYFSASVYYMKIKDLINSVNIGTNDLNVEVSQYRNVGNIDVWGLEFDYVLSLLDREFLRVSYSYCNARAIDYFSFLSNSPKHLFLLKYAKRLTDNLWISFENKYTSSVLDDYGLKVGDYNLTNLNMIYRLDDRKTFCISVHNLFNVRAYQVISLANNYPVSVYPVKLRTIFVNFEYRF